MPFTASVADVAAGEEQRPDDEGVGREREPRAVPTATTADRAARPSSAPNAGRNRCSISSADSARRRRGRAATRRRVAQRAAGSSRRRGRPWSPVPAMVTSGTPVSSSRPVAVVGRARPLGRHHRRARAASRGVHSVPNAGHSCGFFRPCSTSPGDADGRLARRGCRSTAKRRSASKSAIRRGAAASRCAGSRRCRATSRSVTSKTSSQHAPARPGCPRPAPRGAYWFSTSCRPASSCRTRGRMPSSRSSGSNPVTTIGTR